MKEAESWAECKRTAANGGNVLFPPASFLALAQGIEDLKLQLMFEQFCNDALFRQAGWCIGECK